MIDDIERTLRHAAAESSEPDLRRIERDVRRRRRVRRAAGATAVLVLLAGSAALTVNALSDGHPPAPSIATGDQDTTRRTIEAWPALDEPGDVATATHGQPIAVDSSASPPWEAFAYRVDGTDQVCVQVAAGERSGDCTPVNEPMTVRTMRLAPGTFVFGSVHPDSREVVVEDADGQARNANLVIVHSDDLPPVGLYVSRLDTDLVASVRAHDSDGRVTARYPATDQHATVDVPSVVGLSIQEAEQRLRQAGLEPETRGAAGGAGVVIDQHPPAGAAVDVGATVTLDASQTG